MTRNPYDDSLIRDPRETAVLRRLEQEGRRQAERAEQQSIANSPEARIRIWERRHELSLPGNPKHALIDVIADATALTRVQVLEEQRTRALLLTASNQTSV